MKLTIDFPVHPTLNPEGRFNKLQKNGDRWALLDPIKRQTKELPTSDFALAAKAILELLMEEQEADPADTSIGLPPAVTVAPVISDTTPDVGQTISTTNGTWTNSPTSYTYQWKRAGVAISGATSQNYTVVSGDIGAALSVTVTAHNADGTGASTSSGTTAVPTPSVTSPRYFGSSSVDTLDNSQLLALGTDNVASKAKAYSLSPNNQFIVYAYPASLGDITQWWIEDPGHAGFNQIGGLVKTVQSVTPAGGSPTSYNVWVSENQLGDGSSLALEYI